MIPEFAYDALEIDTETARKLIEAGLYEYSVKQYGSQAIGTLHPNMAAGALMLAPAPTFYRAKPNAWRQIAKAVGA